MKRSELSELQYITPQSNVLSILERGILCRSLSRDLHAQTVANIEIVEIRKGKRVPGGLALSEYVNLYVCARNPMLYSLQAQNETICVLRISPDVLDVTGVVVTDANAARTLTRFAPAPEGLAIVDSELVFARFWAGRTIDQDPLDAYRRAGAKCAEVLVPHRVHPKYIMGARTCCSSSAARLRAMVLGLEVIEDPDLFFNR